jgi:hypothetical protein
MASAALDDLTQADCGGRSWRADCCVRAHPGFGGRRAAGRHAAARSGRACPQGRAATGTSLPARRCGPAGVVPAVADAAAAAGNLPTRLTSFLGRAAELVELGALLEQARLVTLTGPGGIGKTSLGTELARAQAPRFRDGAWFVALDLIGDADLVLTVIARTIGLFDGPERAAVNRPVDRLRPDRKPSDARCRHDNHLVAGGNHDRHSAPAARGCGIADRSLRGSM